MNEKETISSLSQVVGALSAVEHNYLSKSDWMGYADEIKSCGTNSSCIQKVSDKYEQLDREQKQQALDACTLGGNSSDCRAHQNAALEGLEYASREIYPTVTKEQDKWWIQNRLESNYQDSQKEPSIALQSEEKLREIDKLLARPGATVTDVEKFRDIIDSLIVNTRLDKQGAYDSIEAEQSFPNINNLSNGVNYTIFGKGIGLEPVHWEMYLLGLGNKGVSATSVFIESNSAKVAGRVMGNEMAKNIAVGSGLNASLQLVSGQPFNWYELAGAGFASAITPKMSVRDSIRTNMGVSMGVSLASDGNPLIDTGLTGAGTWVGSKFKNPIYSILASETVQKVPILLDKKYSLKKLGVDDDKE